MVRLLQVLLTLLPFLFLTRCQSLWSHLASQNSLCKATFTATLLPNEVLKTLRGGFIPNITQEGLPPPLYLLRGNNVRMHVFPSW